MCTVSWLRTPDGYMLFCNRDERLTRKPAQGPRISSIRGVSYVAPVDGDYGGSWVGVNEFGLTLCLLNRYGAFTSVPGRDYTSRGLLLTALLDAEKPANIETRIGKTDLGRYQPFTLLAVYPNETATTFEWTGVSCEIRSRGDDIVPLSSTSLREPGIAITRKQHFEDLKATAKHLDAKLLERFHRSHFPERGPYSVCMHRDAAATMSMSKVAVLEDAIEFVYHPTSPCLDAQRETIRIARKGPYEMGTQASRRSEGLFPTHPK